MRPEEPPEPSRRPPSPFGNPFSDVLQYNDEFFDSAGEKILFSAGHLPDHDMVERIEIQQQINRLPLLRTHSIFGQFSEELENSTDQESTVDGAFAAALRRMGGFDLVFRMKLTV